MIQTMMQHNTTCEYNMTLSYVMMSIRMCGSADSSGNISGRAHETHYTVIQGDTAGGRGQDARADDNDAEGCCPVCQFCFRSNSSGRGT